MKPDMLSVLQSLDQAYNEEELNRAVNVITASLGGEFSISKKLLKPKPKKAINEVTADLVDDDSDNIDDIDVDPENEGMLSNRQPELKVVPASHVRALLIELILLHRRFTDLTKTLNAVQNYVDADIDSFIAKATAWIKTSSDAIKATDVYSADWFSTLPYSIQAKQQLAQALTDTCAKLNASNGYWTNLVTSQTSAVDFAAYAPQE